MQEERQEMKCQECGRTFNSTNELMEHEKTHLKQRAAQAGAGGGTSTQGGSQQGQGGSQQRHDQQGQGGQQQGKQNNPSGQQQGGEQKGQQQRRHGDTGNEGQKK